MTRSPGIRGLVRFARQVRDRLKGGVPEEEQAELRDAVREVLLRVREICSDHPRGPEGLPGPSRAAYRFLEGLDLERLPAPRPGVPPPEPPVRVAGLVATGRNLADELWDRREELDRDDEALEALRLSISTHCAAVEDLCSMQDSGPAGLPSRSRRTYAWLRFLAGAGSLQPHVEALVRAGEAYLGLGEPGRPALRVHLANPAALYRAKRDRRELLLTCGEGFRAADREVWTALLRAALGEERDGDRKRIRAFSTSEAYAGVLTEMESLARSRGAARGLYHDLDEAFDRVNRDYFDGALPRPHLEWSDAFPRRRLGHYHAAGDAVLLSATLDDPKVPGFVVDFVLFHELIHKEMGAKWVNGRNVAHGRAFRARERRFARYREAKEALARLA